MPSTHVVIRIVGAVLAGLMFAANFVQQSPGSLGSLAPLISPYWMTVINLAVPVVIAVGHELLHQFPELDAPPPPAVPAPSKES